METYNGTLHGVDYFIDEKNRFQVTLDFGSAGFKLGGKVAVYVYRNFRPGDLLVVSTDKNGVVRKVNKYTPPGTKCWSCGRIAKCQEIKCDNHTAFLCHECMFNSAFEKYLHKECDNCPEHDSCKDAYSTNLS